MKRISLWPHFPVPGGSGTKADDNAKQASEDQSADRFAVPRRLMRLARRDPDHAAERLMVYAVQSHGQDSWEWAQRERREHPDTAPSVLGEQMRQKTARLARIDGAISGTPSFIALVPAYIAVLWEQARMVLRIAALEGRDPRDPQAAAELLALRGVYPTANEAAAVLAELKQDPPKRTERRDIRTWFRDWFELVKRVLVLGGFISPGDAEAEKESITKRGVMIGAGAVIWAVTWLVPGTLMVLMSWNCEKSTRQLGSRAIELYGDPSIVDRESVQPAKFRLPIERGSRKRDVVRLVLMALAIAIPLVLLFFVAVKQKEHHRIIWLSVLAALSGLALVFGLSARHRR